MSEPQPGRSKSRRLLACVLCQQRKVKCDHDYPCATCVKARVQCVQTTQAPRRKRRPERDLLAHIRMCEDLLKQHKVEFEPLQPHGRSAGDKISPASVERDSEPRESTATVNGPLASHDKRMFHVMREEIRDGNDDYSDDEVQPDVFKKAWDEAIENDDHLLFGWPQTTVAMYTLHPQPVQVFQLWQIYLDNVNPLLKVTHTPSLQGRIIEAAGNILGIEPELEALMFGIYCTAVSSLSEDDCWARFASSRAQLLAGYHLGCQQALLNSRFLRSTSRDCLTALYLYLVSIRPHTTPESLSSMLGIAVRIGQRMGIHNEAVLAKSSALEAEMRRRLWWSMILFDTRIGEMADFHVTVLLPLWDCRVPSNVADSDLPHMKTDEGVQLAGKSTDALFAVVRSELGDFVRRTRFHLGYYAPSLLPTAQRSLAQGEMDALEETIEAKYLESCNPDNPLHFMTVWTTRGTVAKLRLMEHHARYAGTPLHRAESQRKAALSYALGMLECNTKLMTSSLTRGFAWMVSSCFPFVGYIQAAQYLDFQPLSAEATEAWRVVNDNYLANEALLSGTFRFFQLLSSFVLQAWSAREAACKESKGGVVVMETPQIVLSIRERLAGVEDGAIEAATTEVPAGNDGNYAQNTGLYDQAFSELASYGDILGLSLQDVQMDTVDWAAMNWDLGNASIGRSDED